MLCLAPRLAKILPENESNSVRLSLPPTCPIRPEITVPKWIPMPMCRDILNSCSKAGRSLLVAFCISSTARTAFWHVLALDCFLRTNTDVLVLGDVMIVPNGAAEQSKADIVAVGA